MKALLVAVICILTLATTAQAHVEPPLRVLGEDWDHANYWERAQKLLIEGHLTVGNPSAAERRISCSLSLTLREVDGDRNRYVTKRVTFWVPPDDHRYKQWRLVVRDWRGRWRMGRGDHAVDVAHCHIASL